MVGASFIVLHLLANSNLRYCENLAHLKRALQKNLSLILIARAFMCRGLVCQDPNGLLQTFYPLLHSYVCDYPEGCKVGTCKDPWLHKSPYARPHDYQFFQQVDYMFASSLLHVEFKPSFFAGKSPVQRTAIRPTCHAIPAKCLLKSCQTSTPSTPTALGVKLKRSSKRCRQPPSKEGINSAQNTRSMQFNG